MRPDAPLPASDGTDTMFGGLDDGHMSCGDSGNGYTYEAGYTDAGPYLTHPICPDCGGTVPAPGAACLYCGITAHAGDYGPPMTAADYRAQGSDELARHAEILEAVAAAAAEGRRERDHLAAGIHAALHALCAGEPGSIVPADFWRGWLSAVERRKP